MLEIVIEREPKTAKPPGPWRNWFVALNIPLGVEVMSALTNEQVDEGVPFAGCEVYASKDAAETKAEEQVALCNANLLFWHGHYDFHIEHYRTLLDGEAP